jgi:hypothetical protein
MRGRLKSQPLRNTKNIIMKWIKATERLPEIPNPLPPDTEDERGVLFVNRTHSSAYFWFSSYGQSPVPYTTEDGHWALEQYEWLDESESEPHEVSQVQCDLCSHSWVAVRPEGLEKLECPNCGNMVQFENLP